MLTLVFSTIIKAHRIWERSLLRNICTFNRVLYHFNPFNTFLMQNFSRCSFFFLFFQLFLFSSCETSIFSQLRPETQHFLNNQEQARCNCLDQYGKDFVQKMDEGILYINSLEEQYDLQKLSISDRYQIKIGLIPATSMIKTISNCIAKKTADVDELTGLLIQEDLRVVLQLDSTLSDQEHLRRINQPSLEVLGSLCAEHQKAVERLQDLIEAARILPPELQ